MEKIETIIERARLGKGMTQKDLWIAAGLSDSTVRAAENGRKISVFSLRKIARVLEIDLQTLINSHKSAQKTKKIKPQGIPPQADNTFAPRKTVLIPHFAVKIPAGGWMESPEQLEAYDATHFIPAPESAVGALAVTIAGDSMSPDYPDGCTVIFVPVRMGERGALQFEAGKDYYVSDSDGRTTFKRVYFEPAKERYRLEAINPKYKPLYLPTQMMGRMSRAKFVCRQID